ncbi:MAG: MoxR family ATPase [Hyphomonadaceae bacterium]|nr:MoxR family ATPase [Hyphomonadaceae bacterium]
MSEAAIANAPTQDIVKEADAAVQLLGQVRAEIGKVVFGQERVVELVLATILAGGHALLIGAPGLAKTKLVETTARALGLDWGRVQFTPDLMPSDILGSEILDESGGGGRAFRFVKGPIFTSLLMADEINRASPRTQSALLQAMQERHVTVAGASYDLPKPFHVLATQNPIEQEGTYPLPEAQLDRFLLKVDVDYPDAETERRILVETTGMGDAVVRPILDAEKLIALQSLVRRMPVPETVLESILRLIRSARPEQTDHPQVKKRVDWGPSPRAGQALMLAARSRALLRGRLAPSLDDIEALAEPALGHRMALAYDPTGQGGTLSALIQELAAKAA